MMRSFLSLLAVVAIASGHALWAADPAPAATPAPATPAAAEPAPAPAAATPAAPAAAEPSDLDKRIRASREWFGYTYVPFTDDEKKALTEAQATLKTKPDDEAAKKVVADQEAQDGLSWKTKEEKENLPVNGVSAGDNAWMLMSAALVLLMTAPGLALFYSGLVRRKNVLGTMMQSFALCGIVSVIWCIFGFSLAFGGGSNAFFGSMTQYLFLNGVVYDAATWVTSARWPISGDYAPTLPFGTYAVFQMMFAIITPALICGAYAERMKFSGMVIFSALWLVLIYCPMAHMVWGLGGFMNWWNASAGIPAFDFAGGTVVHISSGVAALMCALILGKRKGYPGTPMMPHSLVLSFIGASLLWVGWFGFNAGSALGAGGLATLAFVNTQVATAAAAVTWPLAEWILRGKPTVLGAISGAVAGLVAITPACGFVTPASALFIGAVAGVLCMVSASYLKRALGYDDALDAFGVHAVGGMWGAIATGIFLNVESNPCIAALNVDLYKAIVAGNHPVVLNQIKAVLFTVAFSAIGSAVIFLVVKFTVGVRVTPEQESEGLDLSQHGEEGYNAA
jgi:Amt family ammonium transporter